MTYLDFIKEHEAVKAAGHAYKTDPWSMTAVFSIIASIVGLGLYLLGLIIYATLPGSFYFLIAVGALVGGVREALKWAARE